MVDGKEVMQKVGHARVATMLKAIGIDTLLEANRTGQESAIYELILKIAEQEDRVPVMLGRDVAQRAYAVSLKRGTSPEEAIANALNYAYPA